MQGANLMDAAVTLFTTIFTVAVLVVASMLGIVTYLHWRGKNRRS